VKINLFSRTCICRIFPTINPLQAVSKNVFITKFRSNPSKTEILLRQIDDFTSYLSHVSFTYTKLLTLFTEITSISFHNLIQYVEYTIWPKCTVSYYYSWMPQGFKRTDYCLSHCNVLSITNFRYCIR